MRQQLAALAFLLTITASPVLSQSIPPASPPAATSPGLAVKNLERQLENPITIDAENTTLAEFIASLRNITQTNIVINWNALTAAGLTRDTPITLHLKDVPYEHVIKTLIEILPLKGLDPSLRLNYSVGDNTLVLTTNAELGKAAIPRLYPLARPVTIGSPRAAAGPAPAEEAGPLEIVHAALVAAGEPMEARGHALAMKGDTLAASVSERGQMVIARIQSALAAPTRPGQMPPGTSLTATAKRAQETLARAAGGDANINRDLYLALARTPQKFPTVNVVLLAGTADELQKPTPDISGTLTEGGVLLIGPVTSLRTRTLFAAYDLRDLLRRQGARGTRGTPPPAAPLPARSATPAGDPVATLLQTLQQKVQPDGGWTPLPLKTAGKTPVTLLPYGTTLIVLAPPDVQRQVTATLAELSR